MYYLLSIMKSFRGRVKSKVVKFADFWFGPTGGFIIFYFQHVLTKNLSKLELCWILFNWFSILTFFNDQITGFE